MKECLTGFAALKYLEKDDQKEFVDNYLNNLNGSQRKGVPDWYSTGRGDKINLELRSLISGSSREIFEVEYYCVVYDFSQLPVGSHKRNFIERLEIHLEAFSLKEICDMGGLDYHYILQWEKYLNDKTQNGRKVIFDVSELLRRRVITLTINKLWKNNHLLKKIPEFDIDSVYPSEWTTKFVERIRSRDFYTCTWCNSIDGRTLHVHHIDYDKNNLDPLNLISLCVTCHMKTNYKRNYWEETLGRFNLDRLNKGGC